MQDLIERKLRVLHTTHCVDLPVGGDVLDAPFSGALDVPFYRYAPNKTDDHGVPQKSLRLLGVHDQWSPLRKNDKQFVGEATCLPLVFGQTGAFVPTE